METEGPALLKMLNDPSCGLVRGKPNVREYHEVDHRLVALRRIAFVKNASHRLVHHRSPLLAAFPRGLRPSSESPNANVLFKGLDMKCFRVVESNGVCLSHRRSGAVSHWLRHGGHVDEGG